MVCFCAQRQRRHRVDLVQHAVDAHAHEALRAQLLEHLRVLALALADHRRQQHPALLGGFGSSPSASTWSTIWLTVCASSG